MTISPYDKLPVGDGPEYMDVTPEILKEAGATASTVTAEVASAAEGSSTAETTSVAEVASVAEVESMAEAASVAEAASASVAPRIPLTPPPRYDTREVNTPMPIRRRTQSFRETLLVPDTHPDMSGLLLTEGVVEAGGRIALTVVYKSDTGGVASIRTSIPFSAGGDGEICLHSISAELVNERKFSVYGELLVTEQVFEKRSLQGLQEACGLVLARESVTVTHREGRQSEATHISQDINLREDQPVPVEILCQSIHVVENHRRITAGKLVINGTVLVRALYRGDGDGSDAGASAGSGEDGEMLLSSVSNKTDFTQFVPVKEGTEAELVEIDFPSHELELKILEGRCLRLEGELTSEIVFYRNLELPMVFDVYHRHRDLAFGMDRQELASLQGIVSGEASGRVVVRPDGGAGTTEMTASAGAAGIGDAGDGTYGFAAREFLYASARPHVTDIAARLENGRLVVEGAAEVALLGLDGEGMPFMVSARLPLRGAVESPTAAPIPALTGEVDIHSTAIIKDLWFELLDAGRLEINITVAVTIRLSATRIWLSPVDLAFTDTEGAGAPPALALLVTGSGDTLWSIAKHYKCDAAAIAALNELDPGNLHAPLPENLKLLITN